MCVCSGLIGSESGPANECPISVAVCVEWDRLVGD